MTPRQAVRRKRRIVRSQFLSFARFLRSDFGERHVEWAYGNVVPMSGVDCDHAATHSFLLATLGAYVAVHDLGTIYARPFLMRCNDELPARAPDIMFIKKQNEHYILCEYLDAPADLVIEIVSEESRTRDRGAKFSEYETGGVGEYWILDPARNRAEFYLRDADGVFRIQSPTIGTDGNETYNCPTIPGVVIHLQWLWQRPMPSVVEAFRAWGILL